MNFLRAIKAPFRNKSHKSKGNPLFDKPKQAVIFDIQSKDGEEVRTVKTKAGTVRFDGGVAVLPDDTRADDIYGELKEQHGMHPLHNQFGLVRHRDSMKKDPVHRYKFFQWPGMPYHRYDELGRVIKE